MSGHETVARSAASAGRGAVAAAALAAWAAGASAQPVQVDQGPAWTEAKRADFYTRDQGSEIMPLAWMRALKQPDGQPFLADGLDRYGYLPNPDGGDGLPVGFTAAGPQGSEIVGMTCAACHTRQIEVDGTAYRIDGGPAISDFQSFLADLDAAVGAVAADEASFAPFAAAVLGPAGTPADVEALRQAVDAWYERYHTLMERALPQQPWGPGRLDAVAMIFNRLTGLDIGPPPTFLIPDNIQPADAPVRYPFLWNAAIQDLTQWPGFAKNGSDVLGLARNLGEVLGVFATFHPQKDNWHILRVDYTGRNSVNFDGLDRLEDLIRDLGPPKWPWAVDTALAAQGKAIFERPNEAGGCVGCHGIEPGVTRFPNQKTWKTPIQDVGTDSREYQILARTARTGVLDGARVPAVIPPLQATDTAFNVLTISVLGSIIQHYVPVAATASADTEAPGAGQESLALPPQLDELPGAFQAPTAAAQPAAAGAPGEEGPFRYESRVMEGIWATAPYLHNGSVPSLAELLKPTAERAASFKIGPNYDVANVGLATEQTKFDQVLVTTDCTERDSGNSRCGHEFGTTLPEAEKRALLEYLKTL
jgi:cytochrome c553